MYLMNMESVILGHDVQIKMTKFNEIQIYFTDGDKCMDFYDRINCYDYCSGWEYDNGTYMIYCSLESFITVLTEMLDVIKGGYIHE